MVLGAYVPVVLLVARELNSVLYIFSKGKGKGKGGAGSVVLDDVGVVSLELHFRIYPLEVVKVNTHLPRSPYRDDG